MLVKGKNGFILNVPGSVATGMIAAGYVVPFEDEKPAPELEPVEEPAPELEPVEEPAPELEPVEEPVKKAPARGRKPAGKASK